jgi:hypothetical protein
MIKASDLVERFQQALSEGWGYIFGASGQTWTAEKQAAATREMTVKYGAKWIGHRVADCSGLFVWAFKALGGSIYHGSNTIWRRYCYRQGSLVNGARDDGIQLRPGTAVFLVKNGSRHHIGLYIGGGVCIEAKGTINGVVTSKITHWHEWGELKEVNYEGSVEPMGKLFRGCEGPEVKELQEMLIALGYGCGSKGADGIFGSATEAAVRRFQQDNGLTVDGIAGANTRQTIEAAYDESLTGGDPGPVEDEADHIASKVTITLDAETYAQLLLALQGAVRG